MRPLICLAIGLVTLSAGCKCRQEGGQGPADGATVKTASRRSARLTFLEGSVQVKRSGSMEWTPARLDLELFVEDKVRTGRDSFAQLQFEAGGTLRVGPESLVVVSDLEPGTEAAGRRTSFTLLEGMVEAELNTPSSSDFSIRTPTAEASVLHREVVFQ